MAARTGRPPIENPRNHSVPVRLSEAEHAAVKIAAEVTGVRPGEFIRNTALTAARRVVRRAQQASPPTGEPGAVPKRPDR